MGLLIPNAVNASVPTTVYNQNTVVLLDRLGVKNETSLMKGLGKSEVLLDFNLDYVDPQSTYPLNLTKKTYLRFDFVSPQNTDLKVTFLNLESKEENAISVNYSPTIIEVDKGEYILTFENSSLSRIAFAVSLVDFPFSGSVGFTNDSITSVLNSDNFKKYLLLGGDLIVNSNSDVLYEGNDCGITSMSGVRIDDLEGEIIGCVFAYGDGKIIQTRDELLEYTPKQLSVISSLISNGITLQTILENKYFSSVVALISFCIFLIVADRFFKAKIVTRFATFYSFVLSLLWFMWVLIIFVLGSIFLIRQPFVMSLFESTFSSHIASVINENINSIKIIIIVLSLLNILILFIPLFHYGKTIQKWFYSKLLPIGRELKGSRLFSVLKKGYEKILLLISISAVAYLVVSHIFLVNFLYEGSVDGNISLTSNISHGYLESKKQISSLDSVQGMYNPIFSMDNVKIAMQTPLTSKKNLYITLNDRDEYDTALLHSPILKEFGATTSIGPLDLRSKDTLSGKDLRTLFKNSRIGVDEIVYSTLKGNIWVDQRYSELRGTLINDAQLEFDSQKKDYQLGLADNVEIYFPARNHIYLNLKLKEVYNPISFRDIFILIYDSSGNEIYSKSVSGQGNRSEDRFSLEIDTDVKTSGIHRLVIFQGTSIEYYEGLIGKKKTNNIGWELESLVINSNRMVFSLLDSEASKLLVNRFPHLDSSSKYQLYSTSVTGMFNPFLFTITDIKRDSDFLITKESLRLKTVRHLDPINFRIYSPDGGAFLLPEQISVNLKSN